MFTWPRVKLGSKIKAPPVALDILEVERKYLKVGQIGLVRFMLTSTYHYCYMKQVPGRNLLVLEFIDHGGRVGTWHEGGSGPYQGVVAVEHCSDTEMSEEMWSRFVEHARFTYLLESLDYKNSPI